MELTINGNPYQVLRLLGKGKGGYSYLVTDGESQYVIKQIHHEPCDYYQFGDKLASELRDYERLKNIGIPMPRLLDVDREQERILKEYIPGDTIDRYVLEGGWLLLAAGGYVQSFVSGEHQHRLFPHEFCGFQWKALLCGLRVQRLYAGMEL